MQKLGAFSLAQEQLFDPFAPVEPIDNSEKEVLLFEVNEAFLPSQRLEFSTLITAFLVLLLVSTVLFPKIYLRNSIYYTSRDVAKLEHEYDSLKQEHERLDHLVEVIRYKNQVEDTLF